MPQAGRRGTDFATLFEPEPFADRAKMKDFSQNGRPNGAMTMTRSELEIPSPADAKKLFRSKQQFRPEIVTLNEGYRPSKVVEIGVKKKEISGKRAAQPKCSDKGTKLSGGKKVAQPNGRDKSTKPKGGGNTLTKIGKKKKNDVQAIRDILGNIKLSSEEPLKKEKVEFMFLK